MKDLETRARQISEEIFYKPATNNQANNSIEEGTELILKFANEVSKALLEEAAEKATLLIKINDKLYHGQLKYIAESREHFEVDKQSIRSLIPKDSNLKQKS